MHTATAKASGYKTTMITVRPPARICTLLVAHKYIINIESQVSLITRLTVFPPEVKTILLRLDRLYVCMCVCLSACPHGRNFWPRTLKLGDNAKQAHIKKWFSGNLGGEIFGFWPN